MSVTYHNVRTIIAQSTYGKLETKLILRHVLGLTAAQLIMQHERVLTAMEWNDFCLLKQRLLNQEPLHYILGYREFYSHQFKVTPDTLIPRPETELLVETLLGLANPGMRLLDLGTGCGCIAISAKLECPELSVVAVDKDIATLAVAQDNATTLSAGVEFKISDWYNAIEGVFDIIVSNPPYIAVADSHLAALSYEPQHALTDFNDGLDCLRSIIQGAPNYLATNGWLILEHGYDQALEVQRLFIASGFVMVNTLQDYAGLDRVTSGRV